MDKLGLVEWFHIGDYQHVERVLDDLKTLQVSHLRTSISRAVWRTSEGQSWYRWLLPRLAKEVQLLPYFLCSPTTSKRRYLDMIDFTLTNFSDCFEWIELWNKPINSEWDWKAEPDWWSYTDMISSAAERASRAGKKVVMGISSPFDPELLHLMFTSDALTFADAISVHGFPGIHKTKWQTWHYSLASLQEAIQYHRADLQVWVTEAGFSTVDHQPQQHLRTFLKAIDMPVERVYWYGVQDLSPDQTRLDGTMFEKEAYHYGLRTASGEPKPLLRLWSQGGIAAVRQAAQPMPKSTQHTALITGGAGFIGTNLAHKLLSIGYPVTIFDNLSRAGSEHNLAWLRDQHGDQLQVMVGDMRDARAVHQAVQKADQVFHLAAIQTTNPQEDFHVHVQGTFHLLEALRRMNNPAGLIHVSSSQVYGNPTTLPVTETQLTRFSSRITAEQYVLEYAHKYDLQAVVLRLSAVYGMHQSGDEEDGEVMRFLTKVLHRQPVSLVSDDLRDYLSIHDLLHAFLRAQASLRSLTGEVFNLGGGAANAVSQLALVNLIKEVTKQTPKLQFETGTPSGHYISDTRKFEAATGWKVQVNLRDGLQNLYAQLTSKTVTAVA